MLIFENSIFQPHLLTELLSILVKLFFEIVLMEIEYARFN